MKRENVYHDCYEDDEDIFSPLKEGDIVRFTDFCLRYYENDDSDASFRQFIVKSVSEKFIGRCEYSYQCRLTTMHGADQLDTLGFGYRRSLLHKISSSPVAITFDAHLKTEAQIFTKQLEIDALQRVNPFRSKTENNHQKKFRALCSGDLIGNPWSR